MDDDKVALTDVFDVKEGTSVVERFVSLVKPEIKADGLIEIGECRFSWSGDATLAINTEECAAGICYLMDFTLAPGANELKVVME